MDDAQEVDHKTAQAECHISHTINDLPVEIIIIICKALLHGGNGNVSAICLGLACSRFYQILKPLFSPPITLSRYSTWDHRILGCRGWRSLGFIINHFFGPQYRRSNTAKHLHVPILLNRSIYGDEDNFKERLLDERYYDYYLIKEAADPTNIVGLLPYPYNMGEAWYDEVRDRYGEHGATGWSDEMKILWRSTYVYGRIKSENVLAVWGDWREMMGL